MRGRSFGGAFRFVFTRLALTIGIMLGALSSAFGQSPYVPTYSVPATQPRVAAPPVMVRYYYPAPAYYYYTPAPAPVAPRGWFFGRGPSAYRDVPHTPENGYYTSIWDYYRD